MITISNLTKRFGRRRVLDDVSLTVERGEVVGLVGPNGAGKTTLMRILSGYLSASAGTVTVNGVDLLAESVAVRRMLGYLPESLAFYPEMRVDEYLLFRAALRGLSRRRRRDRLATVKEQMGLTDVGRCLIGQLSRGYRQRVGLADAVIHDPEFLLLDEPLAGLDPAQCREVVAFLARWGSPRQSMVMATHAWEPARSLCRRVVVLRKGRVAAQGTPAELEAASGRPLRIVVEIRGPVDEVRQALQEVAGVLAVEVASGGAEWERYALSCEAAADVRPAVFALVAARPWSLRALEMAEVPVWPCS